MLAQWESAMGFKVQLHLLCSLKLLFFLPTHLIFNWHHEINMRVKSLARQRWKRECDKACERERFLSSWFCVSGAAFVGHIHPSSPIFQIPVPNVSLPLFFSAFFFFVASLLSLCLFFLHFSCLFASPVFSLLALSFGKSFIPNVSYTKFFEARETQLHLECACTEFHKWYSM